MSHPIPSQYVAPAAPPIQGEVAAATHAGPEQRQTMEEVAQWASNANLALCVESTQGEFKAIFERPRSSGRPFTLSTLKSELTKAKVAMRVEKQHVYLQTTGMQQLESNPLNTLVGSIDFEGDFTQFTDFLSDLAVRHSVLLVYTYERRQHWEAHQCRIHIATPVTLRALLLEMTKQAGVGWSAEPPEGLPSALSVGFFLPEKRAARSHQ